MVRKVLLKESALAVSQPNGGEKARVLGKWNRRRDFEKSGCGAFRKRGNKKDQP